MMQFFSLETHSEFTPENGWLEYQFPFGMAYYQGEPFSFREYNLLQEEAPASPEDLQKSLGLETDAKVTR